jgi:hypothetical protein
MASTIVLRLARAATQAEKVVAIKDVTAKEPLKGILLWRMALWCVSRMYQQIVDLVQT